MRTILSVAVALCTGCVSVYGLHTGMHPSMEGGTNAAGVNVGLLYAMPAESEYAEGHVLQLPYGEGFARFGMGAGQLELRVTPALGYLAYRADLVSAQDGPVGIALRPSFGFGLWNIDDGGLSDSTTSMALAPNLAVLISFAGGAGYVAPRFGYLHFMSLDDDSDSTGQLAFGANAGYVIDGDPWDIVLELGFQRVTSTEEYDEGAVYVFSPSVGIQL